VAYHSLKKTSPWGKTKIRAENPLISVRCLKMISKLVCFPYLFSSFWSNLQGFPAVLFIFRGHAIHLQAASRVTTYSTSQGDSSIKKCQWASGDYTKWKTVCFRSCLTKVAISDADLWMCQEFKDLHIFGSIIMGSKKIERLQFITISVGFYLSFWGSIELMTHSYDR
jgi:hypothetical protein